jgi:cell division protein FtsQ
MRMSRTRKQQHPWIHFSKKSFTHFILFFFLISSALYFITDFSRSMHFPIDEVSIVGARHMDHQTIQHSLNPLVSQGFFGVEVDAIKDRILQMPWVEDVSVRRIWPNQVWVMITEKKPIANWNREALLSSTGDLFTPEKKNTPIDLPQFIGPEGKHIYVMEYFNQLNSLLSPLRFKVVRLELTHTRLWNITLNNGMKLTVNHKDFLTRFSHFVKVYPKVVGNRASEIEHVDLRYPNGLAIRWKESLNA